MQSTRAQNIPTYFPTATQARMLPKQFPVSQLTIHRCWLTQFYFSDQPIQTWFLWLLSNRKESGYHGSFVLHVCIIFVRANLSVNPREWAWKGPPTAWKDLPQRKRTVNWGDRHFDMPEGFCYAHVFWTYMKHLKGFLMRHAPMDLEQFCLTVWKRICVPKKNRAGNLAAEIRWGFLNLTALNQT